MELLTSWEKKGRREGKREGKKEGKLEVAERLIKRGSDTDMIMEVTGLGVEEINELAKKVK